MTAGEACEAMLGPTPGLRRRHFDSPGLPPGWEWGAGLGEDGYLITIVGVHAVLPRRSKNQGPRSSRIMRSVALHSYIYIYIYIYIYMQSVTVNVSQ